VVKGAFQSLWEADFGLLYRGASKPVARTLEEGAETGKVQMPSRQPDATRGRAFPAPNATVGPTYRPLVSPPRVDEKRACETLRSVAQGRDPSHEPIEAGDPALQKRLTEQATREGEGDVSG